MKRILIITGIVLAFVALFAFNKMTTRNEETNTYVKVKKDVFEISVSASGELIAEKSIDWNEAEEITTRLAAQVKPDAVVRTPDGQIDLVATAIEKLRKSDGIIETDLVFREATPSEQKLIAESESLRKAWTRENDRVCYYKTYVIFLWAIIIFLLLLVVVLKVSK